MPRYRVTVAYREDDGLIYSQSTEARIVEVTADDPTAARLAAIDKAYKETPGISHVKPLRVVLAPKE